MSLYSLNVETGWLKSGIKGNDEIIKEADLTQKVFGEIPRKASFYLNNVCAHYKLYVMVVNF